MLQPIYECFPSICKCYVNYLRCQLLKNMNLYVPGPYDQLAFGTQAVQKKWDKQIDISSNYAVKVFMLQSIYECFPSICKYHVNDLGGVNGLKALICMECRPSNLFGTMNMHLVCCQAQTSYELTAESKVNLRYKSGPSIEYGPIRQSLWSKSMWILALAVLRQKPRTYVFF